MLIQTGFKILFFKNSNLFLLKWVMIVSILLGFETDAFSQSYSYRHFTVEDGLPTSEVFQVFQDSKGYIWIATNNGVCRYDGYEFKTFTKADGLPDDTVLEIYEDHKNRIWFIPHSVKLSYYFNDSIIEYKYNDAIQKLVKGNGVPEKLMFYVDSIDNIYMEKFYQHLAKYFHQQFSQI